MLYQDGINFVDEDAVHLYGFGTIEDLMAVESMSGHGKQSQYDFFGMSKPSVREHILASN